MARNRFPVLFVVAAGDPEGLPFDRDRLATGAEGLHRRQHRLLVEQTDFREAFAGKQVNFSAGSCGPSGRCRGNPPVVCSWSYPGRHSPLHSPDRISADLAGCRGDDAGIGDFQLAETDFPGGHCTGGAAPALVCLVLSVHRSVGNSHRRERRRLSCNADSPSQLQLVPDWHSSGPCRDFRGRHRASVSDKANDAQQGTLPLRSFGCASFHGVLEQTHLEDGIRIRFRDFGSDTGYDQD